MNEIMAVWLQGNLTAHSFISPDYWKQNQAAVKAAMREATVYVAQIEQQIIGFAGLQENYLAGIFVATSMQNRGVGGQLIARLQQDYQELNLAVYEQNSVAIKFYLKHGFRSKKRQIDTATQQLELLMGWCSNKRK
ncbi:GNAT family N-acetyltransferase [Pediococcus acidilactici]|nr:GNAT family N-acetyltransferase [Pediococcus acidilactici]UWF33802.1 GNAT family N-acetyltransferase [Pediococcus acidilactici]